MMIKRRTETGTSGDTLADSAQGVTEGRGDDGLRYAPPILHELDAFKAALKGALKKGDMVTLLGFGSFYVGKRAARNGRNPQTGATIAIPAAQVPKFRSPKTRNKGGKFSPAGALKDAVN